MWCRDQSVQKANVSSVSFIRKYSVRTRTKASHTLFARGCVSVHETLVFHKKVVKLLFPYGKICDFSRCVLSCLTFCTASTTYPSDNHNKTPKKCLASGPWCASLGVSTENYTGWALCPRMLTLPCLVTHLTRRGHLFSHSIAKLKYEIDLLAPLTFFQPI